MMLVEHHPFSLDNFEGPLDFLLHLVQKQEIAISEVPIQSIVEQYIEHMKAQEGLDVDAGAEFMSTAAMLLLIKSRALLPREEEMGDEEELELDPKFEVIHQLLDYCRFKEAAKGLSEMEDRRNGVFFRGAPEVCAPKPSGVDHLSVDDLASLFTELMQRVEARRAGVIEEEEYRVRDKIRWIRGLIEGKAAVPFLTVFSPEKSRGELIVTFLAVLELMKIGVIAVTRDPETRAIHLQAQENQR